MSDVNRIVLCPLPFPPRVRFEVGPGIAPASGAVLYALVENRLRRATREASRSDRDGRGDPRGETDSSCTSNRTPRPLRGKVLAAAMAVFFVLSSAMPLATFAQGNEVVVVYNSTMPESKAVADQYASLRAVPRDQVIGFSLPKTERMTRQEYRQQLEQPLLQQLERSQLLTFPSPASSRGAATTNSIWPSEAKIRYVLLCYGVPLSIAEDPSLIERAPDDMPAAIRKNEAAVDSELALLPLDRGAFPKVGLLLNRGYAATNSAWLHPTNALLMVARLDGPSAEIARGLADKAKQAETDGLWGRAYFDARGLTNGEAKIGDDWILGAAQAAQVAGFDVVLDNQDARFDRAFPMSQAAFYAGWYEYDGQPSGPFRKGRVEFMPGAFAYHLHSFNAQSIRSRTSGWAGPLLDLGATATMGTVAEPYLQFTPNVAILFHRFLILGFTYGEAAYACQRFLSWQTTVIGDPLYQPFKKELPVRYQEMVATKSKLLDWAYERIINVNLQGLQPRTRMVEFVENLPDLKTSPVLSERLSELYAEEGKLKESADQFAQALRLAASALQRTRLSLALAQLREKLGQREEALRTYQEFLRDTPDYADRASILRQLASLAEQLGRTEEAAAYRRQIEAQPR